MTKRPHRVPVVVAVLTAGVAALVWSGVSPAQQKDPPTELWQEYPLDPLQGEPQPPEPEESPPADAGSEAPTPPVGGDERRETGPQDQLPLVWSVVALVLLLLLLIVPGVRLLVYVHAFQPTGRLRRGSRTPPLGPRFAAVNPAEREATGEARPHPPAKPSRPAKPSKPSKRPAWKRQGAQKPPPVKPAKPSKPDKPSKPSKWPAWKRQGAQKPPPVKPVKPSRPARPAKPPEADEPQPPATREIPPPMRRAPAPPPKPSMRAPTSPAPLRAGVPREVEQKRLTCSIFGWRQGTVADFYALATGLRGHEWVVERSPQFEWPSGDRPPEARWAHARLVEALVATGWRLVGTEGAWYRQRFERPVENGGAERLEP